MDKTYKILLVEDEAPMAAVLQNKLKLSGYEIKVASNGQDALDTLKNEQFDLILLDLVMPKMDGFQVLEELQKNGNKTPVIVDSNLGQPVDFTKAQTLGAVDYFVKVKVTPAEIVEKIKKYLK